jgi:hypothetical protein
MTNVVIRCTREQLEERIGTTDEPLRDTIHMSTEEQMKLLDSIIKARVAKALAPLYEKLDKLEREFS